MFKFVIFSPHAFPWSFGLGQYKTGVYKVVHHSYSVFSSIATEPKSRIHPLSWLKGTEYGILVRILLKGTEYGILVRILSKGTEYGILVHIIWNKTEYRILVLTLNKGILITYEQLYCLFTMKSIFMVYIRYLHKALEPIWLFCLYL